MDKAGHLENESTDATSGKKDMTFDESVSVIFDRNDDQRFDSKAITGMSINGLHNTTDLFWFFTKLLKHGLAHLFARTSGELDLDALSHDDFVLVNRCMNKIGINVMLQVAPSRSDEDNLSLSKYFNDPGRTDLNIAMSYGVINNAYDKLENHLLLLFTRSSRFVIRFRAMDSE